MNHYERLKISPDAPPEVIRAAYRALAAKLHPDRHQQGSATGPDDAMHTQMAALNSAYEVLIDPKLRQDYDATLGPVPTQNGGAGNGSSGQPGPFDESGGPATKVDMDWLAPLPPAASPFWPPSRRMAVFGGGGLAVLVVSISVWLWQEAGQHQMERALSNQYTAHPNADQLTQAPLERAAPEAAAPPTSAAPPARRSVAEVEADNMASRRRPTVDELSHMSDEELLKVLPTLDGEGTPAAAAAAAAQVRRSPSPRVHHPLDGKPLNLRSDSQLIDPLAPEPSLPAPNNVAHGKP